MSSSIKRYMAPKLLFGASLTWPRTQSMSHDGGYKVHVDTLNPEQTAPQKNVMKGLDISALSLVPTWTSPASQMRSTSHSSCNISLKAKQRSRASVWWHELFLALTSLLTSNNRSRMRVYNINIIKVSVLFFRLGQNAQSSYRFLCHMHLQYRLVRTIWCTSCSNSSRCWRVRVTVVVWYTKSSSWFSRLL